MDLSTIASLAGSTVLMVANWVESSVVDNVVSKACDNLADNSEKRNSSTVNDEMLKKLNEAVAMVDRAAHGGECLLQVATVQGIHSPSESRQEAGEVLRRETTSFIAEREVKACFDQGATTSGGNIISDFIPQRNPAAYSNSHHLDSDSDSDSLSFPLEKVAKKRYRGIRQRSWGKQAAEIRDPIKGVRVRLDTFSSAEEATCACDCEARCFRGKKAKVSFPNEGEKPKRREVKSTHPNLNLNSNFAITVPKIEINMVYSCAEVKELSEELVAYEKYMNICGIPYEEGSQCTEPKGLPIDLWSFDDCPAFEL